MPSILAGCRHNLHQNVVPDAIRDLVYPTSDFAYIDEIPDQVRDDEWSCWMAPRLKIKHFFFVIPAQAGIHHHVIGLPSVTPNLIWGLVKSSGQIQ